MHTPPRFSRMSGWIPAFAGMTAEGAGNDGGGGRSCLLLVTFGRSTSAFLSSWDGFLPSVVTHKKTRCRIPDFVISRAPKAVIPAFAGMTAEKAQADPA